MIPRLKPPVEYDLTVLEADNVPLEQTLMNIEDILLGAMHIMMENKNANKN